VLQLPVGLSPAQPHSVANLREIRRRLGHFELSKNRGLERVRWNFPSSPRQAPLVREEERLLHVLHAPHCI
jgi:hypothetical protein